MVLTDCTVLHPGSPVPLAALVVGQTNCSMVVTDAGIVVTLSDVEVEVLEVVMVVNWVAVADV